MPTATQIPVENLLSAGARRRSSGGYGGHGYHGQRLLSAPSLVGLGCNSGKGGGSVVGMSGSEAGMMMVNASQAVARAKRLEQESRRRNRRRSSIQQVRVIIPQYTF